MFWIKSTINVEIVSVAIMAPKRKREECSTPASKIAKIQNSSIRKFQDSWKFGHAWLRYEASTKEMFCDIMYSGSKFKYICSRVKNIEGNIVVVFKVNYSIVFGKIWLEWSLAPLAQKWLQFLLIGESVGNLKKNAEEALCVPYKKIIWSPMSISFFLRVDPYW